ncbi:MAG: TetR/AcrR family transcriptional regulator [Rhodospirillales bacterium]|nr:TetR/AcrR family transcriptional regulator [Rhodospirillales bacterium]
MTRKQVRKGETHQRMLSAASRSFRSHGFAGIGVDGIAKAAGVTSGAFYAHFGSKDGAFDAALEVGLDEVIAGVPKFQKEAGSRWVRAFAEYYLGRAHRDDLACGCAMTTLSPEAVRAGPDTRAIYQAKMIRLADLVANGLAGRSKKGRRARAWAMLGVLIGGLTIARAIRTPEVAEEIAASIRVAAVNAAGKARAILPEEAEDAWGIGDWGSARRTRGRSPPSSRAG